VGVFKKQGVYWIDYYMQSHRKRERIDPDKRLAETVHRNRKVAIAEGKFLEKKRPVTTTFDELAHVYLPSSRKNKRSWDRDTRSVKHLETMFRGKWLTEITPADIEHYKTLRQASVDSHGHYRKPATISRELACLKAMFNVARKGLLHLPGGVPNDNPVSSVKFFEEHNIRDRVLTAEEFRRMLDLPPENLKPILHCAYHTGMRRGELLALTWEKVDLKAGFMWVRQETGSTNTVVHDFRHTATTNLRRAGVDTLTTMKITGHKPMAVFTRYNTIDEHDLKAAQHRMDTYMDPIGDTAQPDHLQVPDK
jgi:integrase